MALGDMMADGADTALSLPLYCTCHRLYRFSGHHVCAQDLEH